MTTLKPSNETMENKQPIDNVEWISRDKLSPNDYNPNSVNKPELELLKLSILTDGWTQPIVVNGDMEIVDGFHRWTLSDSPELRERDGGKVPVVLIEPKTGEDQKMSTVRHNRARGRHSVIKMAEILKGMVDRGMGMEEIQDGLGMDKEEVLRLAMSEGIPRSKLISDAEWSTAWKPK